MSNSTFENIAITYSIKMKNRKIKVNQFFCLSAFLLGLEVPVMLPVTYGNYGKVILQNYQ